MTHTNEEIEIILGYLEGKIKKHVRETILDEREDLEQEIKEKILEKIPLLMAEQAPSIFEIARQIDNDPYQV